MPCGACTEDDPEELLDPVEVPDPSEVPVEPSDVPVEPLDVPVEVPVEPLDVPVDVRAAAWCDAVWATPATPATPPTARATVTVPIRRRPTALDRIPATAPGNGGRAGFPFGKPAAPPLAMSPICPSSEARPQRVPRRLNRLWAGFL